MILVWNEIKRAAKEAPGMYFAPLIGAWRGIKLQYRLLDRASNSANADRH